MSFSSAEFPDDFSLPNEFQPVTDPRILAGILVDAQITLFTGYQQDADSDDYKTALPLNVPVERAAWTVEDFLTWFNTDEVSGLTNQAYSLDTRAALRGLGEVARSGFTMTAADVCEVDQDLQAARQVSLHKYGTASDRRDLADVHLLDDARLVCQSFLPGEELALKRVLLSKERAYVRDKLGEILSANRL